MKKFLIEVADEIGARIILIFVGILISFLGLISPKRTMDGIKYAAREL